MMLPKSIFILKIFSALIILLIYCEFLVYYFVINNCYWPNLNIENEDSSIRKTEDKPVRIMVIADIHLLGPRRGHWFDKLRREWQMTRAFQSALHLLHPELVFILGDIMDEGYYCNSKEFDKYVGRFRKLFAVPEKTKLYVVAGNHDIGFHYEISPSRNHKFVAAFNSSPVQFFTVRRNHFVLLNSMALEGDGCSLCKAVELQLSEIARILRCSKNSTSGKCNPKSRLEFFSKPILMQHYPLYRSSDIECNDFDAAPMPIKKEQFREKWECLSKESTYQILHQVKPRISLSGHTHHGCTRQLPFGNGIEITIPSFNWRNKNNPTIGLGVFTPNNFAFIKCSMPQETTVISLYVLGVTLILCWILYSFMITRRILHHKDV